MAWPRDQWRQRRGVQQLIATVLAAAPLGCSSTLGCEPSPQAVAADQTLTVEQINQIAARKRGTDPSTLTCEQVCEATLFVHQPEIDSCSLTLPQAATGATAEVAGRIVCSGKGAVLCEGRRPLGHVEVPSHMASLGATLAAMAHLEWASIGAFEELAEQVRALGGSDRDVQRCLDAAQDERNHTRWLTDLAAAHGHGVTQPRAEPGPTSLLLIALHNAIEGCVHETWAALCAHLRSVRAEDATLRVVLARIAQDETRHAQLAWDLHDFFVGLLTPDDAVQVQRARAKALRDLPRLAAAQAMLPRELGAVPTTVAVDAATQFSQQLAA